MRGLTEKVILESVVDLHLKLLFYEIYGLMDTWL